MLFALLLQFSGTALVLQTSLSRRLICGIQLPQYDGFAGQSDNRRFVGVQLSHFAESAGGLRVHYTIDELISASTGDGVIGFTRAKWQPYQSRAGVRLSAPSLDDCENEGSTEVVQVSDGLHAIITDWRGGPSTVAATWAESVRDQYGYLYICVRGDGRVEVEGLGRARRSGPSCSLTVAPPGATYLWRHAPGSPRRGVCIAFHARYIKRRYPDLLSNCGGTLDRWLAGRETQLRDFEIPLLPVMTAATTGLLNMSLQGEFRQHFVAATVEQLLCLALSALAERPAEHVRLSGRDRQILQSVRAALDESIADRVAIEKLSRRFGINRNKLQFGFKESFGVPVFEYLTEQRMRVAFELLSGGHYSVGEVATRVGYAHCANFATAFRRRFGRTPSSVVSGSDESAHSGSFS